MGENKTGKYLKYAIGEILLVMIGILLALQVNNWNEAKKDEIAKAQCLENIRNEVYSQVEIIDSVYYESYERKMEGLVAAKSYFEDAKIVGDTLEFLNKVSYGAVANHGIEQFNHSFFESSKNIGIIQLIEDDLKIQILNHYDYSTLISSISQGNRGRYQEMLNSVRPFDPRTPNFISKKDQLTMLSLMKSQLFLEQTNLEMSNANHNMGKLMRLRKSAIFLTNEIDKYLKDY